MNQTFCRAAHDRPARILPAAITHRKNAPPGVVGRRSGYALAPPGHPRQESHPDCRCRLTLIVAGQQSRPPGVISVAFRAPSPGLRFASLMDMDFAVSGPLVRCSRLIPDVCPSTRTFAVRFLRTSPRGDSPCVLANPSPPSGWVEDFHLQATEHAQHTTKSLRDSPLRGSKSRGADSR